MTTECKCQVKKEHQISAYHFKDIRLCVNINHVDFDTTSPPGLGSAVLHTHVSRLTPR